eukprot:TRINITY_DN9263_c1_g2_i2.p1 TRINITY_DN9263_c1_g2~~TRINITY_DN9263_c1_g2_i2.p1  ORF type:complete len:149 (-),score=35.40 TRINITY_DN9263_c1_g2_i2:33-479(-)
MQPQPQFWQSLEQQLQQLQANSLGSESFIYCLGRPEHVSQFGEWLGSINLEYKNTLECMMKMMEYSRTLFPTPASAKAIAREIFMNFILPTGYKFIGPLHPDFLQEIEAKIIPDHVETPRHVFDELNEGAFYRLDEIYQKYLVFVQSQ